MSSTSATTPLVNDTFTPDDLARITADTFIDYVDFHDEIDSTNTRAAELATTASPLDRSTILILADHQSAGRGRGKNQWWSASGALTFSVLLRPTKLELPTERWPLVSLTAGLAVARAIESLDKNLAAQIKWPNDIYVSGRKIGGILTEAATGDRRSIIVGIGLNINNSSSTAPPELREKVTALCDVAQSEFGRADVLIRLLDELAQGVEKLMSGGMNWSNAFANRSLLTNRNVEIESASGRVNGVCQGIDRDGALIVATASGRERIVSGTVMRFD